MVTKFLVVDRNTWNYVTACKLFVLGIPVTMQLCANKLLLLLLLLEMNTWNHMSMLYCWLRT